MLIHPQHLLDRPFAPVPHTYTERDNTLDALSLGLGGNPLDAGQLSYVYEHAAGGFQTVPTFINLLGYCGFWADQPDTGITWQKLLHAEQQITLNRPLAASGSVIGENRVVGLHDKGAQKGAMMLQERRVTDAATGELIGSVVQTTMLRGDGGFGDEHGASHGVPLPAAHVIPDRAPDAVCDLPTLSQAALLYRLGGDYNKLHADPAVAQAAGFPRPILHGLATMGVALHAVLRTMLGYDGAAVRGMRVRFTAPVLPGETLRTELWRDGDVVSLRTTALERDVVVLNSSRVDLG